jgi:hypothetical protein
MTNKVFKEYYSESKKEYKYTLKLAVEDVTDKMLDCLESCLARYELVSAGAFKRTPIQESPLDFPNVRNSPVFISQIVTTYPASRDFLETYISASLKLSEQAVVVYSENDPRAYETDFFLTVSNPEYTEDYTPKLGEEGYPGDITNAEGAELYGAGHNVPFLQELADVKAERVVDIVESPLSVPEENDNASTLPADYDSFNDQLNKNDIGIFGRAPKKADLINKS